VITFSESADCVWGINNLSSVISNNFIFIGIINTTNARI
jgi:hypothetical protein